MGLAAANISDRFYRWCQFCFVTYFSFFDEPFEVICFSCPFSNRLFPIGCQTIFLELHYPKSKAVCNRERASFGLLTRVLRAPSHRNSFYRSFFAPYVPDSLYVLHSGFAAALQRHCNGTVTASPNKQIIWERSTKSRLPASSPNGY